MFQTFDTPPTGPQPRRPAGNEPAHAEGEAVLLWCLRRLVPAGPGARCSKVEVALHRQFGARGQETLVLLHCLLQALAVAGRAPLLLNPPCAATLTADEAALLQLLRAPEVAAPALFIDPGLGRAAARIAGLLGAVTAAG